MPHPYRPVSLSVRPRQYSLNRITTQHRTEQYPAIAEKLNLLLLQLNIHFFRFHNIDRIFIQLVVIEIY